ncbi:hypothetical protein SEA_GARDANN_89 [Mycobacterium phage Gardann]|uniref:Lipoprotein n=1 Tax=Mycobacterium phage Rumpelstiltskin TaxID=2922997 RepID=G3ME65_9CAUD|nr:hypothetical protein CL57_gp085 [Mycobacterium phage Rumpelstiltskin]YP_009292602.1 hypothetical protein BI025_gp094 [Mycobacterium phage Gardann]AEO94440.1 hypothetical protein RUMPELSTILTSKIN_85 [Mycobacterium phage Rumpelstiltskin]ANU79209.1 hypothetical protein SEA_GARDANN_89 [Mycobacterium phage Gardann]ASR87473.1 hypothetical protein SEA_NICHOLASP3_89 [Mycobacterium phage Nicholasp3]
MSRWPKAIVAGAAVLAAFGLSACGASVPANTYKQELPDGRTVQCVSNGPAISCDWSNAK